MYIVSKTSAVWAEEPAPLAADPSAPAHAALVDELEIGPTIRWAARPLKFSHLTCLGLRLRDGLPLVLVMRKGKREWLPVFSVLREAELRRWVARDFVRL